MNEPNENIVLDGILLKDPPFKLSILEFITFILATI